MISKYTPASGKNHRGRKTRSEMVSTVNKGFLTVLTSLEIQTELLSHFLTFFRTWSARADSLIRSYVKGRGQMVHYKDTPSIRKQCMEYFQQCHWFWCTRTSSEHSVLPHFFVGSFQTWIDWFTCAYKVWHLSRLSRSLLSFDDESFCHLPPLSNLLDRTTDGP